jgi:hypothetical protein
MTKVLALIVIVLLNLSSCRFRDQAEQERLKLAHYYDSLGEAKIDSAYKLIQRQCTTDALLQLPMLVDSLIKKDSLPR